MDEETYRRLYVRDPFPEPRFAFDGLKHMTLYFQEYEAAVAYYEQVLGEPGYVEGAGTRGWKLGETWLPILKGGTGRPTNVEVTIVMQTPAEADRLQRAFIDAGGRGDPPSDQLMYRRVRSCPVRDPVGTDILIICPYAGTDVDRPG